MTLKSGNMILILLQNSYLKKMNLDGAKRPYLFLVSFSDLFVFRKYWCFCRKRIIQLDILFDFYEYDSSR